MKSSSCRFLIFVFLAGCIGSSFIFINGLNRRLRNAIEWIIILPLADKPIQPSDPTLQPSRVAHAGGGWISDINQNSLESLNYSYELGLRKFELDFEWTTDNHLVCIHDWEESWAKRGGQSGLTPTLAIFIQTRPSNNFTPITLPVLNSWLSKHQDAFVITDIKKDNLKGLKLIQQTITSTNQQVIPQIYKFSEWSTVHDLNFQRTILTLYKYGQPSFMVRKFIRTRPIWALALPAERAQNDSIVDFARSQGIHVYTHTVNINQQMEELMALGVSEIYTDTLLIK